MRGLFLFSWVLSGVLVGQRSFGQAALLIDPNRYASFYTIVSSHIESEILPDLPFSADGLYLAEESLEGERVFPSSGFQTGTADPFSIINTCLKAWDLVQKNKPVADIEHKGASALPEIAKSDWTRIGGWKPEHVVNYKVSWSNPYGITVASLAFQIRLTYGGSVGGKGLYIGYAQVLPVKVKVNWGFGLDVKVDVSSILNRGTPENPLAEIAMAVTYQIKGLFQNETVTEPYLLRGDGHLENTRTHEVFFK